MVPGTSRRNHHHGHNDHGLAPHLANQISSLLETEKYKLLTLASRVHDNLRDHAKDEVLAKAEGETEAGPVMSILQNFESITVELNISIEVHFVESFNGDFVLSMVFGLISRLFESKVVLDRSARVFSLLVLSGTNGRDGQPERAQDGNEENEAKEDCRL